MIMYEIRSRKIDAQHRKPERQHCVGRTGASQKNSSACTPRARSQTVAAAAVRSTRTRKYIRFGYSELGGLQTCILLIRRTLAMNALADFAIRPSVTVFCEG